MTPKVRNCFDAAVGLGPEDTARFVAQFEQYKVAGASPEDSARSAAADLLADIAAESKEIGELIGGMVEDGAKAGTLTEAQARQRFNWQDMGTKDGTKTHALFFSDPADDRPMRYGEVSLFSGSTRFQVDGGESAATLKLAKAEAERVAIAKLERDGYVGKTPQATAETVPAEPVSQDESEGPTPNDTEPAPTSQAAPEDLTQDAPKEPEAQETAGPVSPITDVGEKIGGARKDTAISGGTRSKRVSEDDRPAWARRFEISQIVTPGGQINSVRNEGRWVIHDVRSKDWTGQPKQVGRDTYATKEEAEAVIPLAAVSLKHRPVPVADGKYEIWRDITDRKRVKVLDRQFDTREEAMAYMAANAQSLIETNTTFGEADIPLPPDRKRTGPQRRTANATGEGFKDTFGFRAVEFGNWNNQDERQDLMNDAWDGLMDLADVLGVPPKALGLNGDLALAFGARGHGLNSARAHYELDRAVINLTKENGAGSLAHEWFHALDHYFGRQDGKASSAWVVQADGTRTLKVGGPEEGMASHGFQRGERSGVRPEVRAAYDSVLTTMFKRAEAYVEDTAKVDKFTGRAKEELAQALDGLRAELAAQKDPAYYKRNNKPASAELLAEVDALSKAMLEGEATALATEWKSIQTNKAKIAHRWTNDSLERLGAIYKEVRGRSGFDSTSRSGRMDRLRGNMERYSQRLKMLAEAQAGTEKTKMVPTEFAMNARELDQGRGTDYWTTPHEMAARAFQGYVEDKVAERGGMSRFLNYGPANVVIITPWGFKRPFPHGTERAAINKAFDAFIGELQTKETDKGVALLSQAPAQPFYSALSRAIESVAMKQGTAGAWTQALKGMLASGKVKADELEWSGLSEFLNLQPGKVSKEAVLEYLRANGVQVQEVVLGAQSNAEADKAMEKWGIVVSRNPEDENQVAFLDRDNPDDLMTADELESAGYPIAAVRAAMEIESGGVAVGATGFPKYSQYTLPGGQNYREVLLTLPRATLSKEESDRLQYLRARKKSGAYDMMRGPKADELSSLEAKYSALNKDADVYRSSHWAEPNVLAHIRLNDRTDAEGKRVLFVEEIQSDWAQKGKKHGFRQDIGQREATTATLSNEARYFIVTDQYGQFITNVMRHEMPPALMRAGDEAAQQRWALSEGQRRLFESEGQTAPDRRSPVGPFVAKREFAVFKGSDEVKAPDGRTQRYGSMDEAQKAAQKAGGEARDMGYAENTSAWVALAIKRVIKMAVDEGYDRVAFVNGEQSAERYDLSKQVRSIEWTGRGNDTEKQVTITPNSGNDIEFKVQPDGSVGGMGGGSTGNEFDGKRLDEIVGKDVAERILGETHGDMRGNGLKVGGTGMVAFYDKIVPAALKDVLKKVGGGQILPVEIGHGGLGNAWKDGRIVDNGITRRQFLERYGTDNAVEFKPKRGAPGEPVSNEQPGFDITPAMRSKAADGLPLFKSTASTTGTDPGKLTAMVANIRAGWADAPPVEVVATTNDLPAPIVNQLRSMNAFGSVRALVMPDTGQVYLIADRLKNLADAQFALFHEVLGHYGLRKFLGADYEKTMRQMRAMNAGLAAESRSWMAEYGPGQIEARVKRGMSYAEATVEVDLLSVEEALSDRAGKPEQISGFKRLVAKLQAWLREHGFMGAAQWLEGKTQAQVLSLLQSARDAVEKAEGVHAYTEPAAALLSQADQTDTPAFKRWFGASKVVDAEGKPLRVYHGTKAEFTEFKRTKSGEFGPAIYLTDNPREAGEYGDGKGWGGPSGTAVMPLYVSIQNPYTKGVDAFWKEFGGADSDAAALDRAQAAGYDGIIAKRADRYYDNAAREFVDRGETLTHFIAFRPEQIKSALGNSGAFDPSDPSILLSQIQQGNIPGTTDAEQEAIARGYKARVKRALKRADGVINGLGELPDTEQYLGQRYRALGKIAAVDKIAGDIRAAFRKASQADKKEIYAYLTTAGANTDAIADPETKTMAAKVKRYIGTVGDQLVARGLISEESREAYRDAYLPRLYLAHLLSDGDWRAIGAGKKVSDMGYLKARKDIPQEIRDVILGEVKDPAFLAATAIAKPMRDMALLDWLAQISENQQWVLANSMTEWQGKRVSVFWLKAEADALRTRARHYPEAANRTAANAVAERMDAAAVEAMDGADFNHKDYKQIPNQPKYGRLRGIYVRAEIYNDLMGAQEFLPSDPGWAMHLLGYGGLGTKATQLWKMSKVALNIPGQVRNAISNGVMLQLSGVPFHKLPILMGRAISQIRHGGRHWLVAKKYGVTESTFQAQEMFRARRDLLDLERDLKGLTPLVALKTVGAVIADAAGDAYQFTEALFKTVKIMDAMEREGMDEEAAAIEAQKWLFDYSLVDKNVRYLRNAPVGMPFLTYTTKVLPRLAEVALLHPQRFLPWVALMYGMQAWAQAMFGGDDDEWDELKKALPKWMQEKGHVAFLPWRDDAGRLQAVDMSYFFPWSQWAEFGSSLTEGDLKGAGKAMGLFGGPVTSVITAWATGEDSFTGRQIINEGDPTSYQAASLLAYTWDLMMPPMMGSSGVVSPMWLLDPQYGGKLAQASTGATNRMGDQKATYGQAASRIAGFNAYGIDPEVTRTSNLIGMKADIAKARAALRSKLGNQGLTPAQQKKLIDDYTAEMAKRAKEMQKYAEESTVPDFARREKVTE